MGSIQLLSANVVVRARAEFLVYAADASIVQRGEVSVVTASHLQLVLLKSIPVFIPASALPEGYTFDADAKYWKLDRKVAKASPLGAIRVIKEGTDTLARSIKAGGPAWWVKGVPNSNKSAIIDGRQHRCCRITSSCGTKASSIRIVGRQNPASDPESPQPHPGRRTNLKRLPLRLPLEIALQKEQRKRKRRRRRRKK